MTHDQYTRTRDCAATLENAGPITTDQARALLDNAQVTVKPVIDLDHMPTSDDRYSRGLLREAVILKNPVCIFPHCTRNARTGQHDHTIPHPDGATRIDNLAPTCTHHHRLKTHGGWRLKQPFNGIYFWQSPTGRHYLIDRQGLTHHLPPPTGREPPDS